MARHLSLLLGAKVRKRRRCQFSESFISPIIVLARLQHIIIIPKLIDVKLVTVIIQTACVTHAHSSARFFALFSLAYILGVRTIALDAIAEHTLALSLTFNFNLALFIEARIGLAQSIIGARGVRFSFSGRGGLLRERAFIQTLTRATLAVTVLLAEEILVVEARDLLVDIDIGENLDASGRRSRRHEFTVRFAVVIYIGGGTEPQLRTLFAARVHDTEVIETRLQNPRLLLFAHLGYTAH